jgi:hypothetical protein
MCALLVGLPDVIVVGVGEWPSWLRIVITTMAVALLGAPGGHGCRADPREPRARCQPSCSTGIGTWFEPRGRSGAFGSMLDLTALAAPPNVLALIFDPGGLRPFIDNWDLLAPALLARARRESVGGVPDRELAAMLDRLEAEVDSDFVPLHGPLHAGGPLIDVAFRVDGATRRYFSTVTTLGTPCEITLQELRIELFHPIATS